MENFKFFQNSKLKLYLLNKLRIRQGMLSDGSFLQVGRPGIQRDFSVGAYFFIKKYNSVSSVRKS